MYVIRYTLFLQSLQCTSNTMELQSSVRPDIRFRLIRQIFPNPVLVRFQPNLLFWPDSSRIKKYSLIRKMISFEAKMSIIYPVKKFFNFTNYLNPALIIFPNVNFNNIYKSRESPGTFTFWKIRQDPANPSTFLEMVKSSPVLAKFTPIRFRSGQNS